MMEAATSATDAVASAQDAVQASPETIQQIMSEVDRERQLSNKPASASMIASVFTVAVVVLAILVIMAFSITT